MSKGKEAGPSWVCTAVCEVKGLIDVERPGQESNTSTKGLVWPT